MKTHRIASCFAAILICGALSAADEWYTFTPKNTPDAGEIGMQDWFEKPAGKHGRITREGELLMYHGAPIKLWGINQCFGACLPARDLADKRAAFYPKFGINAVRLHKYAESEYLQPDSGVEFQPEAIDRMDYQIAKLKEAGIYINLSVHFGAVMLGPADRKYVPYLEEFGVGREAGAGGRRRGSRVSAVHSALFYSYELQTLHIEQMLRLLAHTNAYTGMTYAEDPAIAFIECINEQSILFSTSMAPLKTYPTIRRNIGKVFCDWLRKRYGNEAGLVKAWGTNAFNGFAHDGFPATGESLDKNNILPLGGPWYWDPENLNGSQSFRKQRLLDTLLFLTELQLGCYERYAKALRDAGYDGEIIGSNWQAGRAYSHYANLYTDYTLGTIDRHNYFGGGRRGAEGAFSSGSMLAKPGSGMLSSGMQQVVDRPFMLSEWIHCFPNEWGAEGPAIIGAYGMGLQGWDASFMFENSDNAAFSKALGGSTWDVMAPQVLGVFPAVARQILRGDVAESKVIAARNVNIESVFAGRLGFDDSVRQGYDDKELDSSKVTAAALAAARSVVVFTPQFIDTPVFNMAPYLTNGCIASSTSQLRWKPGRTQTDGFITINTPGTKAVVGFAAGSAHTLGDVVIEPACRFAAIYVTAQAKDQAITNAGRLVIVAMARARNTGMAFAGEENRLLEKGAAPVTLEPVKATITINRPGPMTVTLLDHDGVKTGRTLRTDGMTFMIDGTKDRTPYYLVEFAEPARREGNEPATSGE